MSRLSLLRSLGVLAGLVTPACVCARTHAPSHTKDTSSEAVEGRRRLRTSKRHVHAHAHTRTHKRVPAEPRTHTEGQGSRDSESITWEPLSAPLTWTSEGGELRVNGRPFHLKGTSWFGLETPNEFPHGLWSVSRDEIFGFLRNNSFNAVRLPVSAYLALHPQKLPKASTYEKELHDMTAIQLIKAVVDKAADHGIMIMLDMHRLNEDFIPPLWYDDVYSEKDLMKAWDMLLEGLKDCWNVFALDLKNEPHDMATWGAKSPETDWNEAAERIAVHIAQKHPWFHGLFFVEGVQLPYVTSKPMDKNKKWWGGDLEGVWDKPIDLGTPALNKRVVYSPHVYGPDVFDQEYFNLKTTTFPQNLPDIWNAQWAFVEGLTGRAAVVGEWGGHYGDGPTGTKDRVWQDSLADFMVENCFEDNFYWCLNPNSGDTGGLLDYDFKTPKVAKLKLLERVQPSPSFIVKDDKDGDFVFAPGKYANPKCNTQHQGTH